MRVLVLGHKGMLGNAVYRYLSQRHTVDTTDFRWPSDSFLKYVANYQGDVIVNCIGAIPQKTSNFEVNTVLPVYLALHTDCKVIHPSTDCESDLTLYGISKRIATDWLLQYTDKTYIIKTSIIGIELSTSASLLCWFLNQKNAKGYVDAMWNGVTTLEWAKQCELLLEDLAPSRVTVPTSECLSKFELLTAIGEVFNHNIPIEPIKGLGKNKCLKGTEVGKIRDQLLDLKIFYER